MGSQASKRLAQVCQAEGLQVSPARQNGYHEQHMVPASTLFQLAPPPLGLPNADAGSPNLPVQVSLPAADAPACLWPACR